MRAEEGGPGCERRTREQLGVCGPWIVFEEHAPRERTSPGEGERVQRKREEPSNGTQAYHWVVQSSVSHWLSLDPTFHQFYSHFQGLIVFSLHVLIKQLSVLKLFDHDQHRGRAWLLPFGTKFQNIS